jgi:hypothetical protein
VARKYSAQGLTVITVNLDEDPAAAKEFVALLGKGVEVINDPKGGLAEKYGVKTLPSSFLFVQGKEPVSVRIGYTDAEKREFEAKMAAALLEGRAANQKR